MSELTAIRGSLGRLRKWIRATREEGLGPMGTDLEMLRDIADVFEADISELEDDLNTAELDNEYLREQLRHIEQQLAEKDGAICERDGRINSYERRNTELNDALKAICNRFGVGTEWAAEDAAKKVLEALERDWMRLPVDAYGVPIRIGDMLFKSTGATKAPYGEVVGVSDDSVWFDAKNGWECNWAHLTRHVQQDTVEGIIAEAMSFACEPEAPYSRNSQYVKQYAERIRKAVEHG